MHGKQLFILAALLGLLFVVPSAMAGGWAVVTLDELPAEVRQGETAPFAVPQPDPGRSVLRWAGLALVGDGPGPACPTSASRGSRSKP